MSDKEIAILEYIDIAKVVSVEELSQKLSISLSTVRRILEKLDQRKMIVRFHGGATAVFESRKCTALSLRYDRHKAEKELIAQKAVKQIQEGSTIIMLGGTTVYTMCKFLKRRKLRVITNSLIVLDALRDENSLELIILGGIYNADESEMRGSLTISTLQLLGADALFSGATAFDSNRGFLTSRIDSIELYSRCFQVSKKVYMLADSSKYAQTDVAVTAKVDDVDFLITDNGLPVEARNAFVKKGVQVLIAE